MKCVVCLGDWYRDTFTEPGETCMCGKEAEGSIWYEGFSWRERVATYWEALRWRLVSKLWTLCGWVVPK
mgnify:CR=1 FL=1